MTKHNLLILLDRMEIVVLCLLAAVSLGLGWHGVFWFCLGYGFHWLVLFLLCRRLQSDD